MKKTLVFATLLASSFVARAESMRVHLQAGFPATGAYLPAGDYSISPVTGSSSVLFIEGENLHAFVFGRIVRVGPAQKTTVELEKGKSERPGAGILDLRSPAK
jgi:hypothetical protein